MDLENAHVSFAACMYIRVLREPRQEPGRLVSHIRETSRTGTYVEKSVLVFHAGDSSIFCNREYRAITSLMGLADNCFLGISDYIRELDNGHRVKRRKCR